jgi:hypothetical protein
MSAFHPLRTFKTSEMIDHVSTLRMISTLSHAVGMVGLLGGFAAQWLLFRRGNFSDTQGAVFIPFLGEHGVYTSKLIGIAWYGGIILFLIGFAGSALCWSLERRDQERDVGDKR